ncbi:MAG TPA: hypothetical protein VHY35_06055 [Stellaceae bacterium]|jgi:hypothetical protein|nr:hypothetical protein [Stellaceae bacterium]
MTIPPWTEVQLAVGGALRLACGDRRGLGFFDASLDGFWRSYRAGAICYPFFLLLLILSTTTQEWDDTGIATIVIVKSIAYLIAWVAFPLIILPLTEWLRRKERFLSFMVVYNWSQIPQMALSVLVALDGASGLLAPSSAQLAGLGAYIAELVYEWYIARVTLAVTAAQAMLIVIIDALLSMGLVYIAESLY